MVEYNDSNYAEIKEWYESWLLGVPPKDSLPEYGLIIPAVAAGFLITTNCKLGILEFFISNPRVSNYERHLALDQIVPALIQHGMDIGLKYFKCDTQISSLRIRAERIGFDYIGEFSTFFMKR